MHKRIRNILCSSIVFVVACTGLSGEAFAQEKWSACKPVEAATFSTRIHVKCESAVDGHFWFFAASTADSKFAARALSVIESAQLGDKFINILFDPADQSGPAFGCLLADCRPIAAVVLTETRPGKCDIDSTQRGCPGFCAAINNNDASCPGYCTSHPDNRGCPGYCTSHPNDRSCPGYCATHNDMTCPKNCVNHPDNPECDKDRCRNSHLPGCQQP